MAGDKVLRRRNGRRTTLRTGGFVAWLDLGRSDLDRAMNLLFPAEEDTVDELGLGRLTDAIAERLYPGTTVLMTRPRYLYFVAAIYQHLENARVPPVRFEHERKRLEDRLREGLLKTTDRDVIGRRAKSNLKRYPSSIYWRALGVLGLLKKAQTNGQYLDRLIRQDQQDDAVTTDDGTVLDQHEATEVWDTGGASDAKRLIGGLASGRGTKCGFDLTHREATDLRRRYLDRPGLKDSLLADRLKALRMASPPWPWDCTLRAQSLALPIAHARRVSALARGATLQYYGILLEKRRDQELAAKVQIAFRAWWNAAGPLLRGWNTDDALVCFPNSGAAADDPFLRGWSRTMNAAASGMAAWRDPEARQFIQGRDQARAKSRLLDDRLLRQWDTNIVGRELESADASPYRLDFRHRVGNRVVEDIAVALKAQS